MVQQAQLSEMPWQNSLADEMMDSSVCVQWICTYLPRLPDIQPEFIPTWGCTEGIADPALGVELDSTGGLGTLCKRFVNRVRRPFHRGRRLHQLRNRDRGGQTVVVACGVHSTVICAEYIPSTYISPVEGDYARVTMDSYIPKRARDQVPAY